MGLELSQEQKAAAEQQYNDMDACDIRDMQQYTDMDDMAPSV